MSCSRPSRLLFTGRYNTKTGKPIYQYERYQKYSNVKNDFIEPDEDLIYYSKGKPAEVIEVPCQECEQCKADKAKEWAFRCMAEEKEWKYNYVINLTYNDENLPKAKKIDEETGEVVETTSPTLNYPDVQKFKKDLQRYWKYHFNEDNIRFEVAGEYGETNKRPHYHMIAFNLDIRDLKDHGKTKKGSNEYLSETIQKIWGKGWVTIGDVNEKSIQYIANYTLKKIKGSLEEQKYKGIGICPEFIQMSRKPGIGHAFLMKHKEDYIKYGKLFLMGANGLVELHSCQYLDRIIQKEDPEAYEKMKAKKKELNELREATRAALTGVSIEELRERKAEEFHERIIKAKAHRKFEEVV